MFSVNSMKQYPQSADTNKSKTMEKVYVDWPEVDSDEYRFVSSRLEDFYDPDAPLFPPESSNLSRHPVDGDERYEDLSRRRRPPKEPVVTIPPLDLISQHSSIEMRGAIDIDMRSSDDSISDKTEVSVSGIWHASTSAGMSLPDNTVESVQTTVLPNVNYKDLVLNPAEYDSSRHPADGDRRYSEISAPFEYAQHSKSNEKSIFENTQMKFQSIQNSYMQIQKDPQKLSTTSAIPDRPKAEKPKPILMVAPQIKPSLYSAHSNSSPNFVELNKTAVFQQKQAASSYAAKFSGNRGKRDDSKTRLEKSASVKDNPVPNSQTQESPEVSFSMQENRKKRVKSLERIPVDVRESRREINENPNLQPFETETYGEPFDSPVVQRNPQTFYAFNKNGEPIIINTDNVIIANDSTKLLSPGFRPIYKGVYEISPSYSTLPHQSQIYPDLAMNQKTYNYVRKSSDSETLVPDPPVQRHPTFYDEDLLKKRTKEVSATRTSRFPPLPGTSDSTSHSSQANSYAANFRKKESNYEQYTLRDFKNIQNIDSSGGLGPNVGSEEHKKMKEKLIRQKNYSKAVHEKNRMDFKQKQQKSDRDFDGPVSVVLESGSAKMTDFRTMPENNFLMEAEITDVDRMKVSAASMLQDDPVEDNRKVENVSSKPALSSASSNTKEKLNKREAMLNYSKVVREKQVKKRDSKPKAPTDPQLQSSNPANNKSVLHEFFNNDDLDRLLQRHENDKRLAENIRQKLGNTT